MAHLKIDTQRHISAFTRRRMSLSDWYVLSIPGQSPIPEKEVPSVAAAQSAGDPRGEVSERDCKDSLEKLKARGWLRSIDEQLRHKLKDEVEQGGHGFPLYDLPEIGYLDFTPDGVELFQQLSDELYGESFFSEAHVYSGKTREIYTYREERLREIIDEAIGQRIVTTCEPIGPWCIYWWKVFPSGWRVALKENAVTSVAKGSKKHILDLVSLPTFTVTMNSLLKDTGIQLAKHSYHRPLSRGTAADRREYELEEYMLAFPLPDHKPLDPKWWIPHKTGVNKRPTWDLLCHILVKGKPGLLLVEAKAHEAEMSKPAKDKQSEPTASDRSKENARCIRNNISLTNTLLSSLGEGEFALSGDHHYQLANRLAYLSKLASEGIPTVLIYLGWLKSPDWPKDFFRDDSHWQDVMHTYMKDVVPASFPEKVFPIGDIGGSMQMLIRSLEVES